MRDTAYFRSELFEFLLQLKRHNNREWFAKNKTRYQQLIVEPAMLFIGAAGPYLGKLSPHFVADPRPSRGSLFRIYRDTRFSNDKRPFKTHVGMHFRHAKGKDVHAPGVYLHFEPGNCFVAAGIWHPDTPSLTRIRTAICSRPGDWKKASRKLELEGDTLKRPPRGFDPQHPFIEDLKRKDFIASVELTEAQVCSAKFMRDFFSGCKTMTPLVKFTAEALGLEF
ncbi:MAG: TIGR02453 family protein [Terriglobales bacterium]